MQPLRPALCHWAADFSGRLFPGAAIVVFLTILVAAASSPPSVGADAGDGLLALAHTAADDDGDEDWQEVWSHRRRHRDDDDEDDDRWRPRRIHGRLGFRAGAESRYSDDGDWDEPRDLVGVEYIGMPARFLGLGLFFSYYQDPDFTWETRGRAYDATFNAVPFHFSLLGFVPMGVPFLETYIGGGPTVLSYWLSDLPPEAERDDSDTNGRKYGVHWRWGINIIPADSLELFGEYAYTWLASEEFGRAGPQVGFGLRARLR
ncbi:MAG: hypothetical protein HYV63_03195 [Candidatus Schekmanbacteria bacterium]|nr:hypothetical protein [Candidatus Schekmanbacteria bacterium]